MEIWKHSSITIDDKGRMLLPAKLRIKIPGDKLHLTKGIEECLWLYMPEEWDMMIKILESRVSIFDLRTQNIMRRIKAPHEVISIDKAGRIKLSLSLMKAVGISKACYLIGMGDRLEIWDEFTLDHHEKENVDEVKNFWESCGSAVNASKDIGDSGAIS